MIDIGLSKKNELVDTSTFEIFHHFGKEVKKPIYDEKLIMLERIRETFNRTKTPKKMRPNQRKIFNRYVNSRRLSISEPPGAGKSLAITFAMAW